MQPVSATPWRHQAQQALHSLVCIRQAHIRACVRVANKRINDGFPFVVAEVEMLAIGIRGTETWRGDVLGGEDEVDAGGVRG